MPRSENPFTWGYWLGTVDARPLALFRVLLGLVLLHDLTDLARDLRAFLTDGGMLPRLLAREPFTWSLFDLAPGSTLGASLLLALGGVALVLFTAGLFTRPVTVFLFVFYSSLHNRNLYVTDGGDDLVRILLFWSMFGDLGAVFSADARRRPLRPAVPAYGLRFLQLHVAFFYWEAARLKVRLGWMKGHAIYQTLQLVGFVRPPGAWLMHVPVLCMLLSYLVVLMEGAFPFLALSPFFVRPARALAIAAGLAVQGGILVTMRVGVFTETMIVVNVLWLLPEWLDRVPALRLPPSPYVDDPGGTRARRALVGAMFVQFLWNHWDQFAARRFPLPRAIVAERTWLALVQPADLFGTTYDVPRWYADGVLTDGTPVDVLAAQPELRPSSPGVRFSRWYKFTFKAFERPIHFDALGAYLCARYDEARPGSPKLASFVLYKQVTKPSLPGEPLGAPVRIVLREQQCIPGAPLPELVEASPR